MPASVNSYSISSGMNASQAFLTRGVMKRLAVLIPAIASGSAHAFTLEGFVGPVEGPASGVSSAAAAWYPIVNPLTGSRMTYTTAGPIALSFPSDVVQPFDAVRLVSPSFQLVALNFLVQAKAG